MRLAKRSSNLFRSRADSPQPGLDVAAFDGVLSVDPEARVAEVQGMTTYEHLVEATLRHGLMPLVVPQLRTITLGGAVTGLGIESASFRNGLPHESVLEMEVMTGDGRIVVARPDNEHADLFRGFPNSYGTLGYALRLRIELEPVRPYVRLRHIPFEDPGAYFAAAAEVAGTRSWEGEPVDFMDGTVFARTGALPDPRDDGRHGPTDVRLHRRADLLPLDSAPPRGPPHDPRLPVALGHRLVLVLEVVRSAAPANPKAMAEALPAQRRLLEDHRLRAPPCDHARVNRLRGHPGHEDVIQDIEVPIDRAAEFLDAFQREIGIAPVWMCPLRLREGSPTWPLYPLEPGTTYVNFGFWGRVERRPGERDGDRNRLIERLVSDLGGHKSLYSTAFYERDEFRGLYGGEQYEELKQAYDPDRRLLDLYEKCVNRR